MPEVMLIDRNEEYYSSRSGGALIGGVSVTTGFKPQDLNPSAYAFDRSSSGTGSKIFLI